MSSQTHICQERGCTYATSKKSDLTRHLKRKHGGEDDTSCSELERQDPGELHQYVGAAAKPCEAKVSLQLGRTVRKPTSPDPVKAPIKKLRVHIPAALRKARCVSATELSPRVSLEPSTTETSTSSIGSVASSADSSSSIVQLTQSSDTITTESIFGPSLTARPLVQLDPDLTVEHLEPLLPMGNIVTSDMHAQTSVNVSTQTHAPRHHFRRVRTTKTTHEDSVTEVISEEEWSEYEN